MQRLNPFNMLENPLYVAVQFLAMGMMLGNVLITVVFTRLQRLARPSH